MEKVPLYHFKPDDYDHDANKESADTLYYPVQLPGNGVKQGLSVFFHVLPLKSMLIEVAPLIIRIVIWIIDAGSALYALETLQTALPIFPDQGLRQGRIP